MSINLPDNIILEMAKLIFIDTMSQTWEALANCAVFSSYDKRFCYDMMNKVKNKKFVLTEKQTEYAIKVLYKGYKENFNYGIKINTIIENYPLDMSSSVKKTEHARAEYNPDLLKELEERGIPYFDKRSVGGALWVVGGMKLEKLLKQYKEYTFHFAPNGGKVTSHKPSWWCK